MQHWRKPKSTNARLPPWIPIWTVEKLVLSPGTIYSQITVFTSNLDRNGFLVCTALIDGSIQKFAPTHILARLLYRLHYPSLAAYPGEKLVYDWIQLEFYWSNMTNDVYTTMKDCRKWVHKSTPRRDDAPDATNREQKNVCFQNKKWFLEGASFSCLHFKEMAKHFTKLTFFFHSIWFFKV